MKKRPFKLVVPNQQELKLEIEAILTDYAQSVKTLTDERDAQLRKALSDSYILNYSRDPDMTYITEQYLINKAFDTQLENLKTEMDNRINLISVKADLYGLPEENEY